MHRAGIHAEAVGSKGSLHDAPATAFDAATFGEEYFTHVSNYGGLYRRFNPPHKIKGYLAEIRRVRSSGALLDVGCAFGGFLERARQYYTCEGLDISAYALAKARQVLPGTTLHHGSIEGFTAGRTYDIITCFDVIEHVPDTDLALKRLRALLAPAGILAMAMPVYDTLPGRFFGLIDRDPTHVHRRGRRFWLDRLRQAGFNPIVFKGILRAPLPGTFLHLISPLFRSFSSAIFVIATRREAHQPGARDLQDRPTR